VVALHDRGLPRRHELDGVPIRRARYGPDRWEVLAYRGGLVHSLPGVVSGRRGPRPSGLVLRALMLPALLHAMFWTTVGELRRTRPDVLHAHWIVPGGFVVALLPRRWRPRTVVTLHGTDVELAAGRLRPLARWVSRRVDAVLAVSGPLARRAEQVLDLPAGSVAVARLPLPPGLDPSPIPPGPRRVLAAGRASREKGFDVLVAALAEPEAAEVTATIVAEGPERSALEEQVGALDLSDRVALRPLVSRAELFDLMRGHQVVAVPSRSEGLGMVALEALALGRPVVASAVGGLVDLVVDGADGALVAPDDARALARALRQVPLVAPTAAAVAQHRPGAVVAAHAAAYGIGG
jgi:glycosyltransferase involved in cell wall biosynthesis